VARGARPPRRGDGRLAAWSRGVMRRTRWAAAAFALAALALLGAAAPRNHDEPRRDRAVATTAPGHNRVLVMRLDGAIGPVTDEALENAIARAERERYEALVVEIDTPGGLESSMRRMIQRILAANVPVITYVTPSGAHAASAGVFVTMAGDVAAMAPGTNIGAATPINLQGPMDSTLARKATNDAAAFARTVAAQRGRNAKWAERAVREAVAASETEAVDEHIVDLVAGTLEELLVKADGRPWKRGSEERRIRSADLPVDRIEPGFRQRLLALISDPNVAYILMLLGFYGLLFELQNPGAILPGVVGGISLILAFFALSTLPVNYAGIALILLAIVFFLAEIKVHSHGMLAAGGVISLVLGSLLLFQTPGHGPQLSWAVIAGATLSTAAFFLIVVGAGLRAQRRRVATGGPGLVGAHATVVDRLAPGGRVRLGNEYWNAAASAPLEVGTEVEIIGVDGLTLRVRPLAKEA